jgi:hypothetical protein
MTELDPSTEDLARALRGPATTTELQDEERYLAMFREANAVPVAPGRSLPRRAIGRLGAGGTAVVVTVALTSGVAAAYTGHLPDPVQRLAHTVLGAPAPDQAPLHRDRRPGAAHGTGLVPLSGGLGSATPGPSGPPTPSAAPSAGTAPAGSLGSTPTPVTGGNGRPTGATAGPTGSPTPSPSSSGAAAAMPSALSVSGTTHRTAVGESVVLSGVLTDIDGAALPDHRAVLQVQGARRWRAVAETTTDSAGGATLTLPPLPRSAVFRWHTDHGVHSDPWPVRLVPDLSATADVGGSSTAITATTAGARGGDRVQLYKRTDHGLVLVRHGRLDAAAAISFSVATPGRQVAFVVRLLATPRHTAARARVVVVPPGAARLTIDASTHRVVIGGTTVVSGVVTAADGSVLSGHRVVLQRRGAARWQVVGHSVSGADGGVAISTPVIVETGWYRLRTDHGVHSTGWRLVEVPTMSASASRSSTTVVVGASVQGGRAGDRVVLLRRLADGGTVRLGTTTLTADGTATFTVAARRARTAYLVRLPATRRHGAATAKAVVPRAP